MNLGKVLFPARKRLNESGFLNGATLSRCPRALSCQSIILCIFVMVLRCSPDQGQTAGWERRLGNPGGSLRASLE
ncbi:hypothetical protein L226DRAFT_234438 [Lentinus tigrinus ALCF2SS1-7]|uniref:uncharacterized protein n=1 Tax=Lentinus tigrinus ALCF2SS1-7 TaxID=1328758 RepID=UPI0011661AE6|nr:hypothetical protein L226DRAFT_234438 [Lentinus tigrinus ALCF2SS1-7]